MKYIFVYNADKGFFNALADSAHKILSPSTYECQLCQLTHGSFGMKKEWKDFLNSEKSSNEWKFYHRDEFMKLHPEKAFDLPAIFIQNEQDLNLLVTADTLQKMNSLNELADLLKETK